MELSEVERAYLAGLFDGEGCVAGLYNNSNIPNLRVAITQTDKALLQSVHAVFGGSLLLNYEETERRQALWQWFLSGKGCKDFLEAIYPYLRLSSKKEQVALALLFIEHLESQSGYHLTENERAKRVYLVERIRSLTSRKRKTSSEKESVG